MKKTMSLDERIEKKRRQIGKLKWSLIVTLIVSVAFIFPSFVGGPGGPICYFLFIFGPFVLPLLIVGFLRYLLLLLV